jgi:hypothetical protein
MRNHLHVCAIFLALLLILPANCADPKQAMGDRTVQLIDKFVGEHQRLPNDLSELGVKDVEEGPIYYRKEGEREYIVWYGTRLGSSVVYDSKTKRWRTSE